MSNFICSATRAVEEYNMLDKGDCVIVALSGGADSVSLVYFLLSIKEQYSLKIMAAHINHNLRGEESDRDEQFVRQLCDKYDIELFVKSVDIEKLSEEQKISTELCGRNQRYEFFEELSKKYNGKIATAHTASDNTETVLFNLTRGSGLKGVSGIQPVRGNIIRPLIYVTRKEIEEFCQDNSIAYVTDSSNLSDDYTRNKIRHNVVPALAEINSDIDNTFTRTSKLFYDINDYFQQQINEEINRIKVKNGFNPQLIEMMHPALKTAVIYEICKLSGAEVEYCHIQLICNCLSGGAVDLPNEKRVVIKQNILRVIDKNYNTSNTTEFEFSDNLHFCFLNKSYEVVKVKSKVSKELLNPSLCNEKLYFRTRRQGDMFTLPHRNVTKSVKKLLNELKIPADERDKLLLLTDGKTVYWMENIGVSKQGMSTADYGFKVVVDIIKGDCNA